MKRIETGHWQMGIYHARHTGRKNWIVTVEDGKGFPFEPIRFRSLKAIKLWLGA